MAQGQLGLNPDDFWDDPLRTRERIQSRLMNRCTEAILVDAPPEIPTGARETLPVVVLRVVKSATSAAVPFRRVALVTAVDLGNNYLYAGPAFTRVGRDPAAPPVGPRPGMTGQAFVLDLRKLLDLPWKPSEYLITLIVQEHAFDRLRVQLGSAPGTFRDPEVERYLEEQRRQTNLPPLFPHPQSRLRPFVPDARAPEVPAEKGINLRVPRVTRMDNPDPLVLRCSFRLPVLRRHVMPPGADPVNPATAPLFDQLAEDETPPTGVVRIGLVATGSVVPTPFVWRLTVPTYDPIPPGDGPHLATGSFRVDLQSLGNVKGIEQTLFLYAFSDDVMVGPVPIGFTAEPLIR